MVKPIENLTLDAHWKRSINIPVLRSTLSTRRERLLQLINGKIAQVILFVQPVFLAVPNIKIIFIKNNISSYSNLLTFYQEQCQFLQ